jgi:ATP/maltotriose-dependent transcriptional regulator MalT
MQSALMALWQGRHVSTTGLADMARADPIAIGRFVPGENPVAMSRTVDAWRLWLLGHPDQALAAARAGIACGRALPNPGDLAMVLALSAQVHLWRGEPDEAAAIVEECEEITREHGLVLWQAMLAPITGGIQLQRANPSAAIPHFEQGLDELRRIGVFVHVPALLLGLAEASVRLERFEVALAAIDEGATRVETTLCQWHAPEIWRIRGELLAAQNAPADAVESSFQRALALARAQHARGFELRAATALARRLVRRRRKTEARALLAPVYETFSEGLETPDLRAARAVISA